MDPHDDCTHWAGDLPEDVVRSECCDAVLIQVVSSWTERYGNEYEMRCGACDRKVDDNGLGTD